VQGIIGVIKPFSKKGRPQGSREGLVGQCRVFCLPFEEFTNSPGEPTSGNPMPRNYRSQICTSEKASQNCGGFIPRRINLFAGGVPGHDQCETFSAHASRIALIAFLPPVHTGQRTRCKALTSWFCPHIPATGAQPFLTLIRRNDVNLGN